jgi:hypothetical protein
LRDPASERVLASLTEHGLLLQTDANLPSVCALVTGAPVRGSWWAHPRSHDIFRANCDLAEHPDVLVIKLISGKVTYLHRPLWPAVIAVGRKREPWQTDSLSSEASKLLTNVGREPVQTDRLLSKPASELERKLLVYSEQFHAEAGAHARLIESWDHWSKRTGFTEKRITSVRAKALLEEVVLSLNRKFKGNGKLPWH